jgi:hypothetical protein
MIPRMALKMRTVTKLMMTMTRQATMN